MDHCHTLLYWACNQHHQALFTGKSALMMLLWTNFLLQTPTNKGEARLFGKKEPGIKKSTQHTNFVTDFGLRAPDSTVEEIAS